jgi:2-methylcitrate dehydratase PrpD
MRRERQGIEKKEGMMRKDDNSPTKILCQYVAQARYEDIPKEVIESTKPYIMDSIGNSIGGSRLEPGKINLDLFESMGGTAEATVMATGKKISLLHAVYLNSFLANVLDFDDTYANLAHPGATIIPPAFGVAEKIKASGQQLLTAIVAGYETSLRIGLAIVATPERYKQVWGLSTWQIFGATAASGKLLNLDEEQMRNAFGLGGVNAPVPYARKLGLELEERPFAWSKNNYGWASMGGVLGSLLAQKGFLGNRHILDGERGFWVMAGSDRCDFEKLVEGLGEKYLLPNTSFKPYASCRWTHSTVDACLAILEKHGVGPDDVRSVTVKGMYEVAHSLAEKKPKNIIDAQFSIPYLIGLCITGNSPAKGLSEAHLEDSTVQSLAEKVTVEIDPEADRLYFEKAGVMASTVIIETKGDERFEESVLYPKGSPEAPVTSEELREKFLALTTPVVGASKAEKILERVMDLERVEDISGLFAD